MQKKKGISLIVLVITIIVMLILAATIIISINNANVMKKANEAVETSDIATIKAAADLEYAEYLIDKPNLGETSLGEYLTQKLVEKGTIKGKDKDYYIVMYDNETVVVKVGTTADKYYKEDIKIGDEVKYVATDTNLDVEQAKWYVLGIDKNNQLQITSDNDFPLVLADYYEIDTIEITESDFPNIEEKLHNACKKYGKGYGAVGARSITLEDIYRLGVNVSPNSGDISNVGNTITYYWDGTDNPYYECSNGKTGNLKSNKSTKNFKWFDEKGEKHVSNKSTTATLENKEKITTIKVTFNQFYIGNVPENIKKILLRN